MRRSFLILIPLVLVPAAAVAGERGLLWRVVQACVASQKLIGTPFPCLAVDLKGGLERGVAVVRAPFEDSHIVVTPTVHTIGIEAERLRTPDAPNYFAMAWRQRAFATDDLPRQPERGDLAMAVNSRVGRSQDQLHIHVDCIRQAVKRSLAAQAPGLRPGAWHRVSVLPRAPKYEATLVDEADLAHTNIFELVHDGLAVAPDEMDDITVVVVGATVRGAPGFIVLARRRIPNTRDEAHGEALMDQSCSAFR